MDFYTSKPKLLLMQIFFTLLIVLFLTTFRTVIGIALSLLFIFLMVKTLPDLFISEPVVRFNHDGIQTSNKRNNRFGLILWDDIAKINISSFRFNRFLAIQVKNPEKYRAHVTADKGKLLAPLFQDPSPYITLSFDFINPFIEQSIGAHKDLSPR